MILSGAGGLTLVNYALLKTSDGKPIRYFSSSEAVIEYLRSHPDIHFLLEPRCPGDILTDTSRDKYGPKMGDVFCGQLRYDSSSAEVECT
jgi:hypothetical protein